MSGGDTKKDGPSGQKQPPDGTVIDKGIRARRRRSTSPLRAANASAPDGAPRASSRHEATTAAAPPPPSPRVKHGRRVGAQRAQPLWNKVKTPGRKWRRRTTLRPPRPCTVPPRSKTPQDALAAGRLVLPRNDSALHWALQAQQTGEPGAADVMQRTNTAILNQMKELTNQKRFDEALSFVNAYAESILRIRPCSGRFSRFATIRQAQTGGPVTLQVLHRHGIDYRTARCEGWLAIDPMGNVSYACDPKFVHDARCDRATFPSGSFHLQAGPDPSSCIFRRHRAISTSSPPSRRSLRPSGR